LSVDLDVAGGARGVTQDGLSLRHLQKQFAGVKALIDGCLEARRGEIHGLLGENGAGKSTLIRLLAGVIRRDGGEMWLDSRPLVVGSPLDAVGQGVATVFQESSLIPDLTVEENLLFGAFPLGWHRRIKARELRRLFYETMNRLGVRPFDPGVKVRELSLDDRQLLQAVKAVSSQPNVLILDEATAALTPADTSWVLRQARSLADGGAVVIMVSHRMHEMRKFADRLTVLRGGNTVLGPTGADTPEEDLITAMLGYRLAQLYPRRKGRAEDNVMVSIEGLTVGPRVGPLDLQVYKGEILGIFALPGQGQRQLLLALSGDRRFGGAVTLDGKVYAPRSPAEANRLGVLLVPEDRAVEALFLGHTTQRNVTISALRDMRGPGRLIDGARELKKAVRVANEVGLAPSRLPHLISTLSGGNQQKSIFARVLLEDPRVLVLFDSTRGVDVGTKAEIYQLVASLADTGVTVLFYSSDIAETTNFCDRIAVLHEGRIAGVLARGGATEEELLRLALGGAEPGDEFGGAA
jgi:ribose transport system ATP-binding protein